MLPPHGSKSMIHILQGFSLADVRMTSMFADRKRLFVDLMRWSVPVVDDHYEIDQFDNAEAVYLIAIEGGRSEEHTSELQSLMRISYAVFCLKKKKSYTNTNMPLKTNK